MSLITRERERKQQYSQNLSERRNPRKKKRKKKEKKEKTFRFSLHLTLFERHGLKGCSRHELVGVVDVSLMVFVQMQVDGGGRKRRRKTALGVRNARKREQRTKRNQTMTHFV